MVNPDLSAKKPNTYVSKKQAYRPAFGVLCIVGIDVKNRPAKKQRSRGIGSATFMKNESKEERSCQINLAPETNLAVQ